MDDKRATQKYINGERRIPNIDTKITHTFKTREEGMKFAEQNGGQLLKEKKVWKVRLSRRAK